LQEEFPPKVEIPKLEKLAREEQAEQRKRDGLARARTLLASGRHEDWRYRADGGLQLPERQ